MQSMHKNANPRRVPLVDDALLDDVPVAPDDALLADEDPEDDEPDDTRPLEDELGNAELHDTKLGDIALDSFFLYFRSDI
jgi:hypothetical protein